MEYGLFVSEIAPLPADPRSVCAGEWLHLLPPAPLRAVYFGSEFCPDLLPDAQAAERFCLWALEASLEPVLLTPIVTTAALGLVERLLAALMAGGQAPSVVFNDWGVLNLLRASFPRLRRRAGRLLNRGLRDPRLVEENGLAAGRTPAPTGGLRSLLLHSGVEAVESDADLEGSYLGEKVAAIQRTLHFPFVAAASGRNCLIKADGAESSDQCFTKGLALPCAGLCRGRCHPVQRADSALPLWRAGNTLFYQVSQSGAKAQLAQADRVVLYQRPSA
jgi:hypothetical protein